MSRRNGKASKGPRPQPRHPERAYLTADDMAAVLDISRPMLREVRRTFPPAAVKEVDGRTLFFCRACLEAYFGAKYGGEPDPMLAGGSSPALERYRLARAELAELELAQTRGDLLPRADVREIHTRWKAALQRALELLVRQYGEPAATIVADLLKTALCNVPGCDCDAAVSSQRASNRLAAPSTPTPQVTRERADEHNGQAEARRASS